MLHKANAQSIFYAGLFGLCLSGCAATLDGLKEDLGKVGQKTGLQKSSSKSDGDNSVVDGSAEVEESLLTQIQTLLKQQGFYEGEVDGEFSASTEAAIQDYQLEKGLRIDGRATAEFLESLKAS